MHKAVGALPDLLPRVQALLLDLLSLALARRPFSPATPPATVAALQAALAAGELQGPALTRLALSTLGSFSWTPHRLLDFVRDHVAPYLDDHDSATRRAAAVAAVHVLEQHAQHARRPGGRLPAAEQRAVDKVGGWVLGAAVGLLLRSGAAGVQACECEDPGAPASPAAAQAPACTLLHPTPLLPQTVQRLLACAVADPSVTVRRTVLEALARTSALEGHLAQAECLRCLFVALNDESPAVRSLTIQLAGGISGANPAHVLPALRRHLMQLLSDMDHSPDSRQREGEGLRGWVGWVGAMVMVGWDAVGALQAGAQLARPDTHAPTHPSTSTPIHPTRERAPAGGADPGGAPPGPALHRPRAARARLQAARRVQQQRRGRRAGYGAGQPQIQLAGWVGGAAGVVGLGFGVVSRPGPSAARRHVPPPPTLTPPCHHPCPTGEDGFEVAVLVTMGELAVVAGTALRTDVPEILPLVIDAIQDGGSQAKRLVAVSTLGQVRQAGRLVVEEVVWLGFGRRAPAGRANSCAGGAFTLPSTLYTPTPLHPQVVGSTGCVVAPYLDYPQLLGVLLRLLSEGAPAARREVMRVLGTIGALDPHTHKLNLAQLQGEGRLEREGVRPQFPNKNPPEGGGLAGGGEQALDLLPSAGLVTSSEDYYPTVGACCCWGWPAAG